MQHRTASNKLKHSYKNKELQLELEFQKATKQFQDGKISWKTYFKIAEELDRRRGL